MLSAKEPVMSSRFLGDSTAWWMPKVTSTRRPVRRMGRAARLPRASLPMTAATGLTPAARRAGAREESSTVSTPTTTPLPMPTGLTAKRGICTNSAPAPNRSRAQSPQVVRIPSPTPRGTAVLHQ